MSLNNYAWMTPLSFTTLWLDPSTAVLSYPHINPRSFSLQSLFCFTDLCDPAHPTLGNATFRFPSYTYSYYIFSPLS